MDGYYSLSELFDLGWTRTSIDKYLGAEHENRRNPKYRSAAPMRFWKVAEVERISHTPEVEAYFTKLNTLRQKRAERERSERQVRLARLKARNVTFINPN